MGRLLARLTLLDAYAQPDTSDLPDSDTKPPVIGNAHSKPGRVEHSGRNSHADAIGRGNSNRSSNSNAHANAAGDINITGNPDTVTRSNTDHITCCPPFANAGTGDNRNREPPPIARLR